MKKQLLIWLLIPMILVSTGIGLSLSTFHHIEALNISRERTTNTINSAEDLLSQLRDAETGQRGFLLTGDEKFLEPYNAVLPVVITSFQILRKNNLSKSGNVSLNNLEPLITEKMAELDRLITLRRNGNTASAILGVSVGRGKRLMDRIRIEIANFVKGQNEVLRQEEFSFQTAMRRLFTIILGASGFVACFVMLFTYIAYKEWKQREQNRFHLETLRMLEQQRLNNQALSESNFNLRISEEKLSITLNSIGDAVIATDDQTCITLLNPVAEKLTGWNFLEAKGRPIAEVFHIINQTTREPADIPVRETLDAGTVQGLANHTVLIARDGTEYAIADSCAPIRSKENDVVGAVLVFRDVTQEYAAHQKNLDDTMLMQTILNTVADGIVTVRLADGKIHTVNPAMLKLFDRSEADLNQLSIGEIVPGFPTFTQINALGYDLPSIEKTYQAHRRDGSEFPIEIEINEMSLGGERFFTGIIRNISVRTRLEEEQRVLDQHLKDLQFYTRSLIETNIDAMITTNIQGQITDVNHQMELLTGYEKQELIGSSFKNYFTDPLRAEVGIQKVLIEKVVKNFELTAHAKNDVETVVSYNASTYYDVDGKLKGVVAVARDVTEGKRLAAVLQEKNVELEKARNIADRANFSKSEFLATMSHEIRTPMNGVIGMIDVLQQSNLNQAQLEMTNIIHESAYALLAVINDILDFSKIEANKLEVEAIPLSIVDVIESVCENMGHLAFKKNVELTLYIDPLIPAFVIGDPGRLRQIIINLANNAIKFSADLPRIGKVSVRALLAESAADKVNISFQISDNGIGIDSKTKDKLFSAFIQADTSTTRRFGGTGLGLAITSQLVELMHGAIAVDSKIDLGSKFSVLIPFTLAERLDDSSLTRLKTSNEWHHLLANLENLECLMLSDLDRFADDLSDYLRFYKVIVQREKTIAAARDWIANSSSNLKVIVIDMADLDESDNTKSDNTVNGYNELQQLRLFASNYPQLPVHFLLIGRGRRRRPRPENHDLVIVDANILTAKVFLNAVAIAANRGSCDVRESAFQQMQAAPKQLSREEARLKGSLILVAEDNEINQKVILQQLMLLGQTADISSNGEDALQRWRSGDYGIIFADLHMPKMDGYELTLAIRAEESGTVHIPIIAFTANALKGESERCMAIGMDDFLSKPVQLQNLKAMLEKWRPVIISAPITLDLHDKEYKIQPRHGVINVDVLRNLIGNDEAVILEFLQDFRFSADTLGSELYSKAQKEFGKDTAAVAHKLKSSSRSIGALELGDICEAIENGAKSKSTTVQEQEVLLLSLKKELAKVEIFLRDY
ncbi:PAS domain S-box protein [Undibacterium sp. Ji22W]|uniref:PAS domain S-box protein n=1 Tax=Undibacterium sp. Ji22W TaxID=3413038 RepID=UPI003BF25F24